MTLVPVVHFVIAGHDQSEITSQIGTRPYTLVYDGACKICGRLVRALTQWDREHSILILPSQTPGLHARFPWIPERAYAESVQLIGPHGHTWQGAAAAEQILNIVPRGRFISWIFHIPFVRPIAEKVYRWVARNRYKLGCGEHCQYRPLNVEYE